MVKRGVYRAEREADSAAHTCRHSVIYKAKIAYGLRAQGFINRIIFWRTQNLAFGRTYTFSSDPTHSFINETPGADPTELNHYRPISNLPFISKTLDRVVATQLQSHLDTNNLHEPLQSGFRPKHSTETALVKITNDLLLVADSGLLTILILLDLSAAFDTISHPLLLDRLAGIGITGAALSWFTSYLTGRQHLFN